MLTDHQSSVGWVLVEYRLTTIPADVHVSRDAQPKPNQLIPRPICV